MIEQTNRNYIVPETLYIDAKGILTTKSSKSVVSVPNNIISGLHIASNSTTSGLQIFDPRGFSASISIRSLLDLTAQCRIDNNSIIEPIIWCSLLAKSNVFVPVVANSKEHLDAIHNTKIKAHSCKLSELEIGKTFIYGRTIDNYVKLTSDTIYATFEYDYNNNLVRIDKAAICKNLTTNSIEFISITNTVSPTNMVYTEAKLAAEIKMLTKYDIRNLFNNQSHITFPGPSISTKYIIQENAINVSCILRSATIEYVTDNKNSNIIDICDHTRYSFRNLRGSRVINKAKYTNCHINHSTYNNLYLEVI